MLSNLTIFIAKKRFIRSIKTLAKHYIFLIKSIQPSGPYYLGGWSLGGLIAYEMAQQLMEQGERVNKLYLIDIPALNVKEKAEQLRFYTINKKLLQNDPLYQQFSTTLKKRIIKLIKIEYEAMSGYEIKPYHGDTLLFIATKETSFPILKKNKQTKHYLKHLHKTFVKKNMGWTAFIKHLEIHRVVADHYHMMKGVHAKHIAHIIQESII